MRKVSSQNLVKVICVNFHQNRPNGVAIKCCDTQTDRHTHTHTDTQTGLILDVNIFSYEMTEYKKGNDEVQSTSMNDKVRWCDRAI